jgi:GNAT superfamily N-acetyltransferase
VCYSSAYTGDYRRIVEHIVIHPEQIATDVVYVYEIDGQIAGFYSLVAHQDHAELDFLFVDDAFQGQQIGRMLFQHMRAEARRLGYARVEIVAHPPAAAFYERMGATIVGIKPPSGRVTWERPHMWLVLES